MWQVVIGVTLAYGIRPCPAAIRWNCGAAAHWRADRMAQGPVGARERLQRRLRDTTAAPCRAWQPVPIEGRHREDLFFGARGSYVGARSSAGLCRVPTDIRSAEDTEMPSLLFHESRSCLDMASLRSSHVRVATRRLGRSRTGWNERSRPIDQLRSTAWASVDADTSLEALCALARVNSNSAVITDVFGVALIEGGGAPPDASAAAKGWAGRAARALFLSIALFHELRRDIEAIGAQEDGWRYPPKAGVGRGPGPGDGVVGCHPQRGGGGQAEREIGSYPWRLWAKKTMG